MKTLHLALDSLGLQGQNHSDIILYLDIPSYFERVGLKSITVLQPL